MITETTLHMIAATIEALKIADIEELIDELDQSKKPDDLTTVDLAHLIRKVKVKVQKIDNNWKMRLQAAEIIKERSGKDDSPNKNTNTGEFIDNPEAA